MVTEPSQRCSEPLCPTAPARRDDPHPCGLPAHPSQRQDRWRPRCAAIYCMPLGGRIFPLSTSSASSTSDLAWIDSIVCGHSCCASASSAAMCARSVTRLAGGLEIILISGRFGGRSATLARLIPSKRPTHSVRSWRRYRPRSTRLITAMGSFPGDGRSIAIQPKVRRRGYKGLSKNKRATRCAILHALSCWR